MALGTALALVPARKRRPLERDPVVEVTPEQSAPMAEVATP
jgi:hypothetical protein